MASLSVKNLKHPQELLVPSSGRSPAFRNSINDSNFLVAPPQVEFLEPTLKKEGTMSKLIRKLTRSPSKVAPKKKQIAVTYTKTYEDFEPPENYENIPAYNKI